MGNYLKIAADRALGRAAPAVQPRIPSLFEPPSVLLSARFTRFATTPSESEHDRSFAGEHSLDPAQPPMQEVQRSSLRNMRDSREALPKIELGQNVRVQDHTNQTPTVPAIHPKIGSTQSAIGAFEQHREAIAPAVVAPPSKVAIEPRTAPETALHSPVRVEPAPSREPAPVPRSEIKPEIQARTFERHVERSVAREVIERVRSVQPDHAPARQLNATAGLVRTAPASQETGFSSNEPSQDARPVINVVIGRVSVQAVTERPAVTAKVVQPPAPMLSLDRYLEQRRGQS